MRWTITPHRPGGRSGWRVLVRLFFDDPNEHATIYRNRTTARDVIKDDISFRDIYASPGHTKLISVDSSVQTDRFIWLLDNGLKQIDTFIQDARSTTPRAAPRAPEPEVPWNFFDDKRFEHVHMVADTGSGKTTFLSALIKEDLDKVAHGDASVIIIDSQNDRLSWDLPHIKRFAPGGDLHGRLIYLKPDLDYPLALNIFDFSGYESLSKNEQYKMRANASDALTFFMGITVDIASGHMENVIDNALRAIALIPNPTVLTLQELLSPGGMAKMVTRYPQLKGLDEDTQRFLDTRMERDYKASLPALRDRLDGLARDFIKQTFAQPQNKLNLFELLERPHVIILNTDKTLLKTDAVVGLFGRYMLAALLGVVRKRVDGGLPCYVYFDEAQQYLEKEEAVVKLINEARRQKISLTVAYHDHKDIQLDTIKRALTRAHVQLRPVYKDHQWYVTLRGEEPVQVKSPAVDFKVAPKMTDEEWQAIVDDMHVRFSCDAEPTPDDTGISPDPKNNSLPPIPDADAR